MIITHSFKPSIGFKTAFYSFCIDSKPYDFCCANSIFLRNFKIEEYLNSLHGCYFVEVWDEDIFRGGAAFDYIDISTASLEFVFGNKKSLHNLAEGWQKILDYAFKTWKIERVESVIHRKKNLKGFMRWIKKNDPRAIIEGEKIYWTNDRQS